jgi:hypothetical protein
MGDDDNGDDGDDPATAKRTDLRLRRLEVAVMAAVLVAFIARRWKYKYNKKACVKTMAWGSLVR